MMENPQQSFGHDHNANPQTRAEPPQSSSDSIAREGVGSAVFRLESHPAAIAPWFLALVGWTALLSFYQLGGGAGFEPVDCWVAQPSREMHENVMAEGWRGLVKPYFAGELFLHKSPGPYWAVNLAALIRGEEITTAAVRTPGAVAAVLFVACIFWLTRRIAGDRAAIFAGFAAAGSICVLYWSHRGSADLAVSTLCTLSLTCLWIGSETESAGWKRVTLWMIGYFCAGLAMIYKMPMPLVCVGIPALLYVLLRNRWRIFASPWHLLGLALFCLPWLPWAIMLVSEIPAALPKWRVEFWDRITGDLPNVVDQFEWYFYLMYVGAALLLAVPFSLSLPQALVRACRRNPGVRRDGQWFVLIWFLSLFVFFTISTGKETRYFLPAMPPLFVMLGIELAAFFDPRRAARPALDRLGFWAVALLTPAGLIGCLLLLRRWYLKNVTEGMFSWAEVFWPALAAAAVFAVGVILAARLYQRRRENASFAALVGTMWLVWLCVWPTLMPRIGSQAAYVDFAAQLRDLAPEYKSRLRHVGHHDPRVIWYSDARFPRLIDQLELLQAEGGRRNLERERRAYGEKMAEVLAGDELSLMAISVEHYAEFMANMPEMLAAQGKTMPETHVWLYARLGRPDRRYLICGNQPPPWPEPAVILPGTK